MTTGYKQTEVGVIPEDWEVKRFGDIATLQRGYDLPYRFRKPGPFPIVTSSGIEDAHDEARVKGPGVVTGRYGTIGEVFWVQDDFWPLNTALYVRNFHGNDRLFISYLLRTIDFHTHSGKSGVPGVNRNDLHEIAIRIPPTLAEQQAIAEALSDADALIESLEQLIAKKRHIKQGAMQELLTGKKRLPGFGGEWGLKRIEEIARLSCEKNAAAERLPVLTCSKHLGFVDSLGYFKNQVFSRDTSGYKVVRRGQIGYPSNHIEEGSIGLQDLYDVALVSPIYVVFSVTEDVNSFFLHRLLKLDSYRQKFETATTASVDRRGSLRWPAFSQITVTLPKRDEQTAIAAILSDMDAEIAALETKLAKARQIKQGMMRELLTGRIRLVNPVKSQSTG